MIQRCEFNELPATINNGGYKKGHWIVWLNLSVSANTSTETVEGENEWKYASQTDRLVLSDNSVSGFLKEANPLHLALATTEEIEAILKYFHAEGNIESWRMLRKVQIQGYDSSDKVNCFYLGEQPMWLDKATRVGLVNSLNIEKAAGREVSELWFDYNKIDINVELALKLLAALELYAKDCYGVTASHIAMIESAQTIEELRSFDIGADYPEIPVFHLG
jgi:hypothetical protein